jgi:hypothetical protein
MVVGMPHQVVRGDKPEQLECGATCSRSEIGPAVDMRMRVLMHDRLINNGP